MKTMIFLKESTMKTMIFLLALGSVLMASASTPVLSVPKVRIQPVIDGAIAPGEWDDAAAVAGLQLTNDRGFAKEQTRFYFKWEAQYLYIAAVCSDSNMADIDLKKPYNDCLEFFVMEPGSPDVTHWLLYAAGKSEAIRVDYEYGSHYVKPEGKAETAVGLNEKDWTIECRIPVESFSRTRLSTRYPLLFNIYRSFNENGMRRKDGRGPEYGGFVHVSGQLFKPLDFAEMRLAEPTHEPVRMIKADSDGCRFEPISGAEIVTAREGRSAIWTILRNGEVIFKNRYDEPVDFDAGQDEAREAQRAIKGVAVNVYDSMTSINPAHSYAPKAGKPSVGLMLAQNEREAAEIMVLAGERALRKITLRAGELKSADDDTLPASAWTFSRMDTVVADPVGYPSAHGAGDYYDPLRPFEALDIPAMRHALVWAEVRTTAETRPGLYAGEIVVAEEGHAAMTIPVTVNVRNFTLPRRQSFRTAFNLWERELYRIGFEGKKRKPEEFVRLVDDYLALLVDHRLAPLINRNLNLLPEDFARAMEAHYLDAMKTCVARGSSGFCIGPEVKHEDYAKVEEKPWKELWRKLVRKYRDAGLIDFCYAYPVDEPGNSNRLYVNRITKWMKEVAPELRICVPGATAKMPAASFDHIDMWCPASHWVNWRNKEIAQKEGKQVWWYPCSGPWYPYPNYHLDIEPGAWRIQTWMSWKWKFDGILYWAAAFWNPADLRRNNSYSVNGDGVLVYPLDVSCSPVPSVRLKVICDSMEDYEYFVQLDRLATKSAMTRPKLAARARQILQLDGMVEAMDRYALRGEQYNRVRSEIADLIEQLK